MHLIALARVLSDASTTQPAPGVVTQFFNGIATIIASLGGIAGITALVLAILNRGALKQTNATAATAATTATAAAATSQNIAQRGEQIAAKVNEVTRDIPSIENLPPPPRPLIVTPADVTAAASSTSPPSTPRA